MLSTLNAFVAIAFITCLSCSNLVDSYVVNNVKRDRNNNNEYSSNEPAHCTR